MLAELEALYRTRLPEFRRVAAAIAGDRELGRDAVQEAFASAVRKRASFRGDAARSRRGSGAIVVNAARDARRRRPRARRDRPTRRRTGTRRAAARPSDRAPARDRLSPLLRRPRLRGDRRGARDQPRHRRRHAQRRAADAAAAHSRRCDYERRMLDELVPPFDERRRLERRAAPRGAAIVASRRLLAAAAVACRRGRRRARACACCSRRDGVGLPKAADRSNVVVVIAADDRPRARCRSRPGRATTASATSLLRTRAGCVPHSRARHGVPRAAAHRAGRSTNASSRERRRRSRGQARPADRRALRRQHRRDVLPHPRPPAALFAQRSAARCGRTRRRARHWRR